MSEKEDYDSDAPEEFTQEQTIAKHDEISQAQKESKARVVRERKERRKQQAQRITARSSEKSEKNVEYIEEPEENPEAEQSRMNQGFLPRHVVEQLTAREEKSGQASPSDSEDDDDDDEEEEEEEEDKAKSLTKEKKKRKSSGTRAVVLEDIPPPKCLKNSLEFLKKRKMQVARSSSVLNNSNQALRLVSGMLTKRQ